ncbi:hypothetical protein ACLQ24_26515 [Micromonospora sp. DT4]
MGVPGTLFNGSAPMDVVVSGDGNADDVRPRYPAADFVERVVSRS